VGLFLAALWYGYALGLKPALGIGGRFDPYIVPLWESLLCLAMCIGLTILFREALDLQTRLSKWLAQVQYSAYVFHTGVVVGFQALALALPLPPFAKFVLVSLAAVPVSFLVGGLFRKPLRL
jgi:surface polysaccharide O-acyltransferase-like enzyme